MSPHARLLTGELLAVTLQLWCARPPAAQSRVVEKSAVALSPITSHGALPSAAPTKLTVPSIPPTRRVIWFALEFAAAGMGVWLPSVILAKGLNGPAMHRAFLVVRHSPRPDPQRA